MTSAGKSEYHPNLINEAKHPGISPGVLASSYDYLMLI